MSVGLHSQVEEVVLGICGGDASPVIIPQLSPVVDEASATNTTAEQQEETTQKTKQSSFTVCSGSVGVPARKA